MTPKYRYFFDEAEGKYRLWFDDWGIPPARLPFPASCDTRPKDGDAVQHAAPLAGSAVPEGQTPNLHHPKDIT